MDRGEEQSRWAWERVTDCECPLPYPAGPGRLVSLGHISSHPRHGQARTLPLTVLLCLSVPSWSRISTAICA